MVIMANGKEWGQKDVCRRPERTPLARKAFRQSYFYATPELPAKQTGRCAALQRTSGRSRPGGYFC